MVSYDKGFGVANNDDGTHVYRMLQHLPKVREGDVLSLAVRVGHNAHRCVRYPTGKVDNTGYILFLKHYTT